jgi:hypothetical protein
MSAKLTQGQFNIRQGAIYTISGGNLVAWKIPSTEYDKLTAPKGVYDPAYAAGNRELGLTRTPLQTRTLKQSRVVYEPIINTFVASWVKNNSFIPDEQKLAMGVHIDSISVHHNVAPTTHPEKDSMDLTNSLQISLDLKDSVSGHKAKPDGVLRIESLVFIQEMVLDSNGKITVDGSGNIIYTMPVTEDDYHHWGVDSSSMENIILEFVMTDGGKPVMIRNRYANNVDHGPLGPVINAIIPK